MLEFFLESLYGVLCVHNSSSPASYYIQETGLQFCLDYNREHYSDIDDNQLMVTKQVDYINYEMLYDIEKMIRNEQNLTNQQLMEKLKKYLKMC